MVAIRENHPDVVKLLISRVIGQRENASRPRTAVDLPELGTQASVMGSGSCEAAPATRIARTDSRR